MKGKPRAGRCFNCKANVGPEAYCYGCRKRVCDGCDDGLAGPKHGPKDHLGPNYYHGLRIAARIALRHAHDMARMARLERKTDPKRYISKAVWRECVAQFEGMAHEAICIYSEIKSRLKR